MKPTDLSDALNDVDPALIEASAPEPLPEQKRTGRTRTRLAALAAALVVILGIAAVLAWRGAKHPAPAAPGTDVTQQTETDRKLSALLRPLTAYAAQYPAQTPYPAQGDLAPQSELDAWNQEQIDRRLSYFGAGKTLDAFFTRSLPAFLGGNAGQNTVCSPLNIYFALAMLAEMSDGNTRAQVLSLLGAPDVEAMRTQANRVFNANYRNDGSVSCILADSLWLNKNVSFRKDTLETLGKYYYASTYRGQPGTETFDDAIRAWVNGQTGGLLQNEVAGIKTDPLTMLALYTTAYFGDKWQAEFRPEETKQGIFHSPDGDRDVDYMRRTMSDVYYWGAHFSAVSHRLEDGESGEVLYSQENGLWGIYFWGAKFGAVKKDLQQGGSVWFLLPDEGTTPEDLLQDSEALRFLFTANKLNNWKSQKSLRVNLALPKFDVSAQLSLKEGLQTLGVTDCFTEQADFSPLTDDQPIAVSDLNHGARVVADEQGVTAAAYTEMMLAGAAMPPEEEIDFHLDRPFLFAVVSEDRMPLFVGIVNQPT